MHFFFLIGKRNIDFDLSIKAYQLPILKLWNIKTANYYLFFDINLTMMKEHSYSDLFHFCVSAKLVQPPYFVNTETKEKKHHDVSIFIHLWILLFLKISSVPQSRRESFLICCCFHYFWIIWSLCGTYYIKEVGT